MVEYVRGERTDGERVTAEWSLAQDTALERTNETVVPSIDPPAEDPAEGLHVWDSWLLRNRAGEIATIDGWRVLFSLTTTADILPGKRHDSAEIRYFYSRDGEQWQQGGLVFEDGALGQRQWAGSALSDDGELYLYYTAAGEEGAPELTYTQRLAVGYGGSISTTEDELTIEGPWTHELLLEPDGEYYEQEAQSEGMIYTFRDPWFFEDPNTGETYLLFEANTPITEGHPRNGEEHAQFNGSVGVAHSPGDPLDWTLQPPLLDAVTVNQELERPHIVVLDGRYYLFVSSHRHTFAPTVAGFDGLYGFVADSLRGEYRPLNDTGLVLTNPGTLPYQSYSWMAFRHREEILVQSFLNYHDFGGSSLDQIGDLSEAEQKRRFAGTLGPTVRVAVDGQRTRLTGLLDHWHIPTPEESLPPFDPDWPPEGLDLGVGGETKRSSLYTSESSYRDDESA